MGVVTEKAVSWTESGLVPDAVIRAGIRRLLESNARKSTPVTKNTRPTR